MDLQQELQQALGDSYRIERELGGGGMSRVFLATEASLNRSVVIKLLPPDMTSDVSAARFKREMELTAQLQHPHVLPILAAGARGNFLYYVMPYVSGETLRHRLERGALPVPEATRILREIADALAYAHRHNVVHRDVKPENILIEDDHAVLADFGVARAVAAAGGDRITGTGMSVGTPGYMAPEQMTGEQNIDGRADVYALAVVAYEMFAGHPPFTGKSAQAVITAHLTTPALPLIEERPDVPPTISNAVARALSKDPDDRYRTAGEFRDALDTQAHVAGSRSPAKRRRMLAAAGLAAAVVLAVGGGLLYRSRAHPALDANLVAIAPFDVLSPDLQLWKEGLVDVLARNLDGAGPLRTVSPSVVVRGWAGRADKESALQLGRRTGAQLAVFGTLEKFGGDSVRATATLVDVATGRAIADTRTNDVATRMDRLVDSVTVTLLRELGRTRPVGAVRLAGLGSNSLAAMKAFLQGEQYFRRTAWDSALADYDRAIALDSTFALALQRDANVRGWMNQINDSLSNIYAKAAAAHLHGLAPRESLIILSDSIGRSLLRASPADTAARSRHRRLFQIADLLAARYPNDPEAWYSIGEDRFHFGTYFGRNQPRMQVLEAFDRSIKADPGFAPSYIHAIELAYELGTAEDGLRYVRAYNALASSGDAHAEAMRLVEHVSDPKLATSAATQALLDSSHAAALQRAYVALRLATDSTESTIRLGRAIGTKRTGFTGGMDSTDAKWAVTQPLDYRGHHAELRRMLAEGRERPGFANVAWPVYEASWLGIWPADTLRMLRDAILAQNKDPMSASRLAIISHDTTKYEFVRHVYDSVAAKNPTQPWTKWSRHFVDAWISIERADTTAALAALDAVPDSLITGDPMLRILKAELLMSRKRDAQALELLRPPYFCPCAMRIALALARARAAERVGERETAIDNYLTVSEAWRNADPELRSFVDEARAGLKRLGAETARRTIKL